MKRNDRLEGMLAICQYVNRSESTVLIWIRDMDFPAAKVGGIWESSRKAIDKWWGKKINGRPGNAEPLEAIEKKGKKGKEKNVKKKKESSEDQKQIGLS